MDISLVLTEKFNLSILENLEMETIARAVKIDRVIQDQMKRVEKRNKGRNRRTNMSRGKMKRK